MSQIQFAIDTSKSDAALADSPNSEPGLAARYRAQQIARLTPPESQRVEQSQSVCRPSTATGVQ